MAQRDPKTIADGFITLIGGMDSGKSPSLLRDDQASEMWNTTVRGGYPTNRPGFKRIPLTFATEEIEEWFTTQVHQGSIVFRPYGSPPVQVWSVGGRIFTVDILMGGMVDEITPRLSTSTSANFTVPGVGTSVAIQVADATAIYPGYPILVGSDEYQVSSISGSTLTVINVTGTPAAVIASGTVVSYLDANASLLTKVWMQQADRFLIIQDGFSRAIIFDGASSRRADPARLEVPTGTVMAFGLGRLWVAINEREFVAGDIIYGPTGTPLYNYADAILKFTENTFLAEGGAFSLPFEAGKITAMDFMPVWDTSTGQGPLMVFTESSATSVDASPSRETWKTITSPIQAVSMRGPGPKGSWSTVPIVNGDIFFRSADGIRSLALAIRGWGDWGSTPMSTEMDTVMIDDDESWLFWTSAIVFDNRLLMTSGNRPGGLRPKFAGIVALDFHILSAMAQKLPPVYDGTWTGISIWQLFKGSYDGRERAFAAVENVDGLNELWEITKANKFDNDEGRIVSTLISRNLFNKNSVNFKRLFNCEVWVDEIIGTVDFTLYYRSDQYPCWTLWNTARVCVEFHNCTGATNCSGLAPQFRPGYKTRIGFGQPADGDENNDAKPIRIGYEFQIMLKWEGRAKVRKVRIKAMDVDEQPNPDVGIITVGCAEVDPELIPTPAPEPEETDMPLNAAVYDSTRQVIWAVRGGFLFKMNATTGARIDYARICVPDFDDAYIEYFPGNDRLYITSWMTWGSMEATTTKKNVFEVNPDTMLVEDTFNLDSALGFGSDGALFESGPAQLIAIQDYLVGIYYGSTQSNDAIPYRFEPGGPTFLVGTDVNIATNHRTDVVYDADLDYIWFISDFGAISYDRATFNQQTTVNLAAGINARGIAYRQGQLYFVVANAAAQQFYSVLKRDVLDVGPTVTIDMARPNARPFHIRYNPVNDRLYVPTWMDDTVVIIDPTTDTVESVKTGFESPWDVVFTPTKAFAIQHGMEGLKEIV